MGFLLLGLLVTMLGAGSALADTVTCLMGNSMGKCIETTSNNGETLTLQVALSSFFDLTDVTIAGFGSSEVDVTRFSVTQPNANWTPTAITGGSPSPGYTETWNSAISCQQGVNSLACGVTGGYLNFTLSDTQAPGLFAANPAYTVTLSGTVIPEPSSLALLVTGLLAITLAMRKRIADGIGQAT